MANIGNSFIRLNVNSTTGSGWLKRLVRPFMWLPEKRNEKSNIPVTAVFQKSNE